MAVSINLVYQKVLSLSNKEQRGYITPQEFNILADIAQNRIFERYFDDVKTAHNKPNNNTTYSDELDMLSEKMKIFRTSGTLTVTTSTTNIPTDIYKLDTLELASTTPSSVIEEVSIKEITYMNGNQLTAPSANRMVFVRGDFNSTADTGSITLYPTTTNTLSVNYYGWSHPNEPNWDYVVVNEKALYNSNTSVDFDLHACEEENLVTEILQLAGVVIKSTDIQQAAMADKQMNAQEKNN